MADLDVVGEATVIACAWPSCFPLDVAAFRPRAKDSCAFVESAGQRSL